MLVKTAYYQGSDFQEGVNTIAKELAGVKAKVVFYFYSSDFDAKELAKKMQDTFAGAITFGSSTAGEIVSGKMLKKAMVAMALPEEIVKDAKAVVLEKLNDEKALQNAFLEMEKYFGVSMMQMDPSQYIGSVLTDGLSGAEEWLLDKMGNMTNVLFVGGSAGDDLKFKETTVAMNGKIFNQASVLLLIKSNRPFEVIKTQSFKVLDKVLEATKVNEAKREVIEFNGKPAKIAYAEAVGCAVEDADKYFMINPIGLVIDEVPFVRSPQRTDGNNMFFYCNVLQDMEYSLLAATDIIEETKKAIENKKKEMGNISAILNFHCILRTLQLDSEQKAEKYGEIFKEIPTVGFSTYGEAYLGHINQTSTMIAWK